MSDKEEIRAEIKRRYNERDKIGDNIRANVHKSLISFIDSMQEEPVCEELEEEIIRYIGYPQEVDEDISTTMTRKAARHFANWQKQQLMKEAVEGIVQDDFQVKLSDGSYIDLDPSMQRQPAFDVKAGERIKLKMFKED